MEKEKNLNYMRKLNVLSALARVAVPLPNGYSAGAQHHAQRAAEAPPGGRSAEENELEDKSQHHVNGPHQGHGSSLLKLQRLGEEALASDAQDSDQNQHPAIAAAVWHFPLAEDGYGDDAVEETDDSVVPHGQVVVDALPHLADDNKCKGSRNRS